MLILASDFDTLEFVLLDKRKREASPWPANASRSFPRRSASTAATNRLDCDLRRFTWTCRTAWSNIDKLRSVFDSAAYTGEYFQNRASVSDYYPA